MNHGVRDNAGTGGELFVAGGGLWTNEAEVRSAVVESADRYVLFELLVSEVCAGGYGDLELPPALRWRAPR